MAGEYYALVLSGGQMYNLPYSARPANDWGEQYDLTPSAGTHASVFYMAGTGKPLPTTLDLVMELETQTEPEMEALIKDIVSYAKSAVALQRYGGTSAAGWEVSTLMGLVKYGRQAIEAENSVIQQLTLSLARAAPEQLGFASDMTVSGTSGTSSVAVEGIAISGVPTVQTTETA